MFKNRIFIPQIKKESFNPGKKFLTKPNYKYLHEKITGELLVPYNHLRFNRLKEVLDLFGIIYHIQSNHRVKNIIVRLGKNNASKGMVVLGAHYDIVKGSFGINDNTCSVAMLINLIIILKDMDVQRPIEIVFFDGEETGMHGSQLYVNEKKPLIDYAIILDIIGVGDTLIMASNRQALLEKFKPYGLKCLEEDPASDNLTFKKECIPYLVINAIHRSDLLLVGEKYKVLNSKVDETMHGGLDDDRMEIINFRLVEETINIIKSIILQ